MESFEASTFPKPTALLSIPEPTDDLAMWNQILSAGAGHLDQIIVCRPLKATKNSRKFHNGSGDANR
jgi:hypothetical protein